MNALAIIAQPGWLKKAYKATATLYTVTQKGDTLSTPVCFIDDKGTAVCALFPLSQAKEAWVITYDAKRRSVERIQGFNTTYQIARISTADGKRKTGYLTPCSTTPKQEEPVYLMPKANQDKIIKIEPAEQYNYYTLQQASDHTLTGYALMNNEGQIVGVIQNPIHTPNTPNYALDIRYPMQLSITPMDANTTILRESNILMQLPENEDQARSFLYLLRAQPNIRCQYAQDFIKQFPKSCTGYIQLAENLLQERKWEQAYTAYETGLQAQTAQPDEIYYARANAIYVLSTNPENIQMPWTQEHALSDIQKAIAINPIPLYTLLEARILFAQKDYEAAHNRFIALTQTNMRDANLFLYAAQCMEQQGKPDSLILALNDSAVACFTKPYATEAANAIYLRSQRLKQMKRYREAVRDMDDYEHLLQGKLNDLFYFQRYEAEANCRMYAQALEDIAKAIQINNKEPIYYAQQAVTLYRIHQPQQAIASCQAALAIDPQFPDVYRIWGICLRDQGKTAQAREKLQRAAALGDSLATNILQEMK